MARAAWAIHVPGDGGGGWAGPVQGAQTAQRGELMAAVAATLAMPRGFLLVTDSRYVRDGIYRLRDGEDPSEWRHADLWALVRARAVDRTLSA
eukprot:7235661-Lingulodinium_polyedra.AAC.1